MSMLHLPQVRRWTEHLKCRVEGVQGRFAVTLDDGPNRRCTPAALDVLRRHGAHATFFLLAGNIRRHPDLVRRLVDEGHEPGLHGEIHWPLPLLPRRVVRDDIERSVTALAQACGATATWYRPPFGVMTRAQVGYVRSLGYESVLGDVFPDDPWKPGVTTIVERVMARLRPGSILILHDGSPLGEADRSQSIEALDVILERAAAAGLAGVTVGELMAAGGGPPRA